MLCERFLPLTGDDPTWRFNRALKAGDREQGWKLHIPATIFTACEVLERSAPLMVLRDALFKAPATLEELEKINSGLSYEYTQIGKFITVYPRSDKEAVFLARRLHRATFGMNAPAVPYDLQFRPDSCVFYRYGAFIEKKLEGSNGETTKAVADASGNLVPDDRENPKPEWIAGDPFQPRPFKNAPANGSSENPLETTYRVFRALRQRGKGGVYQAIDISSDQPRFCIIKEGRRHGEIDWDGRDGFRRVKLEAEILAALQKTLPEAPRFYGTFERDNSFFLAMEYIEGKSLHELLRTRQRRFSIKQVLSYAGRTAGLIARLHAAGWMWRDCKPANIIVTADGSLRPLDFEGSCRINEPDITSWRTASFSPPFNEEFFPFETGGAEDLYSLGAMVYYLLTANFYLPDSPVPVEKLRRNIPKKMRKVIAKLLSKDPRERPSAVEAASEFNLQVN